MRKYIEELLRYSPPHYQGEVIKVWFRRPLPWEEPDFIKEDSRGGIVCISRVAMDAIDWIHDPVNGLTGSEKRRAMRALRLQVWRRWRYETELTAREASLSLEFKESIYDYLEFNVEIIKLENYMLELDRLGVSLGLNRHDRTAIAKKERVEWREMLRRYFGWNASYLTEQQYDKLIKLAVLIAAGKARLSEALVQEIVVSNGERF